MIWRYGGGALLGDGPLKVITSLKSTQLPWVDFFIQINMIRLIFNITTLIITLFVLYGIVFPSFVKADDFQDAVRIVNNRDFETAYKMLVPLAEKGQAAAQLILGMMYFKGTGVEKNIVQADKWLLISEKLGQEAGKKNRIFVERQMSSDQILKARKLAKDWLQKP